MFIYNKDIVQRGLGFIQSPTVEHLSSKKLLTKKLLKKHFKKLTPKNKEYLKSVGLHLHHD